MTKINAEWHKKNPMPKGATLEQRMSWHLAHSRACGCREISATVRREMSARGIPVPKPSRAEVPDRKPSVLRRAIPVLHVSSSMTAEKFYCEGLGFKRAFVNRPDPQKADPCYLGLTRDGLMLHLSSFPGDGVSGGVVMLIVDDVDALYAELKGRGVHIALKPTDQTWGNREMYVKDEDGNSVRFVNERGGKGI